MNAWNGTASADGRAASLQAATLGGVLVAGALLAYTSLRLPLICPLRAATGVPCPLCGMTTGTVASLRGDLGTALSANPFSLLVVPGALAGILMRLRAAARGVSARRWSEGARRWALAAAGAAAAASWIFQLFRFDLI